MLGTMGSGKAENQGQLERDGHGDLSVFKGTQSHVWERKAQIC